MKKVLAIIGSPRKGETYKAVCRFIEELNKVEQVQVEYIMLSRYAISDCTGCHNCIKKGEETCHENVKVHEIQDKIKNADGIILSTPVYNQHVTALMKKFMDYLTFLWHRPSMFGVKFFGVSSGGGMFGPVFKYLKMNVESWGGIWVDGLGVPHYDTLTEKFKDKVDEDIRAKARKFIKAMEVKTLPRLNFSRLMWFNIWKMNAEAGKEDLKKDYEHWSKMNWFNTDYYYDVKVGILKRIAIKFATGMARMFMRRVYKGY
ncbi:MAG: NAD(P)H-dependent oxidoreductase [Clostridia bacterium]|nr:NAD(P)H-dependent oxidoreductase [Clostridia bacterium]